MIYLHEAQTHQLLAQSNNGKLDCAILAQVKETETFIKILLYKEPMRLAIYEGHSWFNRKEIKMRELIGQTYIGR